MIHILAIVNVAKLQICSIFIFVLYIFKNNLRNHCPTNFSHHFKKLLEGDFVHSLEDMERKVKITYEIKPALPTTYVWKAENMMNY